MGRRMGAGDEMLRALGQRRKLFSLPQRFYNDPDFFALDIEAIFHRRWLFAGATCEIPKPGDYFTLTIGRSPIVVLRDRAGDIRAFFNTCRHRGSKLCTAERGRAKKLVCPYHQWSYDLDGRLVAAGHMHKDFDIGAYTLKPVHARTLGGTIYICLADEPPDFAPYKATVEPYLAPHDLANAKLAYESHLIERGNWKLVMENSRECYHCAARHPELMRTFLDLYDFDDPRKSPGIVEFYERCAAIGLPSGISHGEDFRVVRLPFTHGAVSTTMDGKPAVTRLLGHVPHNDIGSVRWVHYPSTFNHALGDYAVLIRMLPIDAQTTLVTAKWLVDREAEEGRDYDLRNLVRIWDETNSQDRILVERNQEGVNSIAYQPGPYSQESESGVIRFVEWYCRTMETYLEERRGSPGLAA